MKRICKWCGREYNPQKDGSSKFCPDNPNREKNLNKKRPPKIVTIGCLVLPQSPFIKN